MVFKLYYRLTKPGIIYGNLVTAAAGFLLPARVHIDVKRLIFTLLGIALVIGASCVFNNYIDREIDKKMARTRHRALASGKIPLKDALIFGSILAVLGFIILAIFTNWLTVLIGLIGVLDYVVLYGFTKRRTPLGTLVGSISGAMPPVAGYTAVTNRFDTGAILLLLILVCWQMPHFYAIALYRLEDYKAAGLPVLPIKRGLRTTKLHMLVYVLAFAAASLALYAFGYTGFLYFVLVFFLSVAWFWKALQGFSPKQNQNWPRNMFRFSLIVITLLCILMPLGARLP